MSLRKKLLDTFGAQVFSDHERYPADVKCLSLLYLYVGRYPRNNASRNTPARRDGSENKELHDTIFAPVATQGHNSGAAAVDCEFPKTASKGRLTIGAQNAHLLRPRKASRDILIVLQLDIV